MFHTATRRSGERDGVEDIIVPLKQLEWFPSCGPTTPWWTTRLWSTLLVVLSYCDSLVFMTCIKHEAFKTMCERCNRPLGLRRLLLFGSSLLWGSPRSPVLLPDGADTGASEASGVQTVATRKI
ncbi:uncharacterized protein ACIB01_004685 isoform 1-T1 [Guaruba guarouba]